jgi:pimeloyl-ACP methyl ester carboxylesterase
LWVSTAVGRSAVLRSTIANRLWRLGRLGEILSTGPSGRWGRETLESRFVDLEGPVHFIDFGGTGPTMVLVHGLGGSHENWLTAGPGLAAHARVLALDLAGFGRTPLAGRSARVRGNQRLLGRFLDELVGEPAVLVGNSMGGMIALLEAADHPERVAGLVLVDPAVPRPRGARMDREGLLVLVSATIPGLGERLVARRRARGGAAVAGAEPGPEAVTSAERVVFSWPDAAFLQAMRSLVTTLIWPRRYLALIRQVQAPTLVVHGAADRLVPLAAVQALARSRPEWTLRVLDGAGHVPQLEAPGRFVEVVGAWLDAQDGRRGRQAG